jgi:DNA replication protein DnaC
MDTSDEEMPLKRRRVNRGVERLEKLLGYDEQCYFDKLPMAKQLHLANLFKNADGDGGVSTVPAFFRAIESIANTRVDCPSRRILTSSKSRDEKDKKWANIWIEMIDIAYQHNNYASMSDTGEKEEKGTQLKIANEIIDDCLGPEHRASERLLLYFNNMLQGRRVGKSLGLYGPAGNGKTTVATDCVGRVLNRPVVTIALGGCNDASRLVGHNFTYEGSQPGAIIQGILDSRCHCPIFLMDELDKVGKDEVVHALLHIIDETQNARFVDNYMGFPIDISESIFIFTYNDRSQVSPILLNRIDQLHIPAITIAKRREMAEIRIMPTLIEKYNLDRADVYIHPDLFDTAVDQTR